MAIFQDNTGLAVGLFVFVILCILVMLLRNRAAKTDSVGRSEKDTVSSSVSLDAKENTKKLD